MKILIVAMSQSIHTARWAHQIADQGWDVHLFPSMDVQWVNPELEGVTVHQYLYYKQASAHPSIRRRGLRIPNPLGMGVYLTEFIKRLIEAHDPDFYARRLRKTIEKLQPDIIHSLEFQHSGYLTLDSLYLPLKQAARPSVRQHAVDFAESVIGKERLWRALVSTRNLALRLQGKPPLDVEYAPSPAETTDGGSAAGSDGADRPDAPAEAATAAAATAAAPAALARPYSDERLVDSNAKWVVTSWGSDIYLFGRMPGHADKLRALLSRSDFFSAGCNREIPLAKSFGFCKTTLPVFASTGGFHLDEVEELRQGIPSQRRIIVLKGYQHFAGRALVGLRALERCADLLEGYTIAIPMALADVLVAADLFQHDTGIPVRIVPHSEHREMLRLHGSARMSIGLSISDGLPGFLLEAMAMGSFPIQSWTSCADEWIEDKVTGLLVPPEDPEEVEQAIRTALLDDDLVDRAAVRNWEVAQERLDHHKIKGQVIDFYSEITNTPC